MLHDSTPTPVWRRPDLVWRLGDGCVIVRRVEPPGVDGDERDATLIGAAARVWVAADGPITATQLALDTDLDPIDVDDAIALLADGGWLDRVGRA